MKDNFDHSGLLIHSPYRLECKDLGLLLDNCLGLCVVKHLLRVEYILPSDHCNVIKLAYVLTCYREA